jgi:hypothetical protein
VVVVDVVDVVELVTPPARADGAAGEAQDVKSYPARSRAGKEARR